MSTFFTHLRRIFSRELIIAALVLAIGLIGMQTLTSGWELLFAKEDVPLRKSLDNLPHSLGPYQKVFAHHLTESVERTLNTKDYISWIFRDTRKSAGTPGSGLMLHIAYYTGNQEPVSAAHVPEICYVRGGYRLVEVKQSALALKEPVAWELGSRQDSSSFNQQGGMRSLPVREFRYMLPNASEKGSMIYFFIYNGDIISSRNEVAMNFLNFDTRRIYYCKVEVKPGTISPDSGQGNGFTPGTFSSEETQDIVSEFLTLFLPEIKNCMPTMEDLNDASPQENL